MTRALGEFLAVFWLLGLVVGLGGLLHLLAVAAAILFAVDLLLTRNESQLPPRLRRQSMRF